MRTTLNIEDNLLDKVSKMTGIKGKTALVKLGLKALIARESARRFAKLGGTQKQLIASAILTGVSIWTLDKKLA
ncbi:type II toxin-antitoxin system VapB family antitoxin [bacterium]|nr:type II toxin-antitoxin system VapB family antitoxin [bacterium]